MEMILLTALGVGGATVFGSLMGFAFKNISHKIPGSTFAYDSPGTFMLTAIVERVTGKPFLEYMKEKALKEEK